MACNIIKKLDVNECSLAHLTLVLLLHYLMKFISRTLAIYNNEFILGHECVGSEMINWITTNMSNSDYFSESLTFLLLHVLKMSSSVNASGRHWCNSLTACSIMRDLERLSRCWWALSVHRRTILKWIWLMLNMWQILNDFVVSLIFWVDACAPQYEFIVVNSQTMISAFQKVV